MLKSSKNQNSNKCTVKGQGEEDLLKKKWESGCHSTVQ